jgi:hypothetical protein
LAVVPKGLWIALGQAWIADGRAEEADILPKPDRPLESSDLPLFFWERRSRIKREKRERAGRE